MSYVNQLRLCVSATPDLIKFIYFLQVSLFAQLISRLTTKQVPFEVILFAFLLSYNWKYNRTITAHTNIKPSPLLSALCMDGLLYLVATIVAQLWAGCIVRAYFLFEAE